MEGTVPHSYVQWDDGIQKQEITVRALFTPVLDEDV